MRIQPSFSILPRLLPAALGVSLAFAGCASDDTAQKQDTAEDTVREKGAKRSSTTSNLKSGINQDHFDTSVRAQDDLYLMTNGTWLKNFEIPADKSNYGSFTKLFDEAELNLRAIIEDAGAGKIDSPEGKKVGDAYKAFLDEKKAEELGITPLDAERKAIADLKSVDDVAAHLGHLSKIGVKTPIGGWIDQDSKDTTQYILWLNQSGLGLPDRDYMLVDNDVFKGHRAAYKTYIADLLVLAGRSADDAKAAAERIYTFEEKLAKAQWSREQSRDREKAYNKKTAADLATLVPGFNWTRYFSEAGLDAVPTVIVRQPEFFTSLSERLKDTDLATWKDYLELRLLSTYAPKLSKAFVDLNFNFYGKTLSGVQQNRPRWKRGVAEVEHMLGFAVGKIYVERHFKPEAKERMEKLVANLREAFRQGIDSLEWMSPDTKKAAQEKLKKFVTKIGYPNTWRDYGALEIKPDDLLGNAMRAAVFEHNREMKKLGAPIDRDEWFMTPQTINAYYNPSMNEIVFPAAILQPPFFNLEADDAVNYGGIGAVIGHEFSHGFDDQGSKTDGDGMLRDWWQPSDKEEFKKRTQNLAGQYDQFSPIEGEHVNGKFTLGENIGDLGGLTIAYRAYELSLEGKDAPIIDGFTGPQRFFLGWGQIWARKYREEELRRRLKTDPHSPSHYRVIGIVSNMPEFYKAFDLKEGDKLWRKPEERVKIW